MQHESQGMYRGRSHDHRLKTNRFLPVKATVRKISRPSADGAYASCGSGSGSGSASRSHMEADAGECLESVRHEGP